MNQLFSLCLILSLLVSSCGTSVSPIQASSVTGGFVQEVSDEVDAIVGGADAPLNEEQQKELAEVGVRLNALYGLIATNRDLLLDAKRNENGDFERTEGFNTVLMNIGLGGVVLGAGASGVMGLVGAGTIASEKAREAQLDREYSKVLLEIERSENELRQGLIKNIRESSAATIEDSLLMRVSSNPSQVGREKMLANAQMFAEDTVALLEFQWEGKASKADSQQLFRNLFRLNQRDEVVLKLSPGEQARLARFGTGEAEVARTVGLKRLTLVDDYKRIRDEIAAIRSTGNPTFGKLTILASDKKSVAAEVARLYGRTKAWLAGGLAAVGISAVIGVAAYCGSEDIQARIKVLDGRSYEEIKQLFDEKAAQYRQAVAAYNAKYADLIEANRIKPFGVGVNLSSEGNTKKADKEWKLKR